VSEVQRNKTGAGIAALRKLGRSSATAAGESCELCNGPVGRLHRHLLEPATRRILCACDPCATCFQGVTGGRYRLIPRDVRPLPNLSISDEQWDALALPINLAFFFHHTPAKRVVALYPGPAGAVESELPLTAWSDVAAESADIAGMESDVEALLVRRIGGVHRYYIAPIDVCFRLVGLFRLHWKGLAGGTDVWREVGAFFDEFDPKEAEAVHA
jgi:hypothetical protein